MGYVERMQSLFSQNQMHCLLCGHDKVHKHGKTEKGQQRYKEGSSLRGISRISGRAYGTVVSLVRDASQKAQMLHNQEVQQIDTEEVIADDGKAYR